MIQLILNFEVHRPFHLGNCQYLSILQQSKMSALIDLISYDTRGYGKSIVQSF